MFLALEMGVEDGGVDVRQGKVDGMWGPGDLNT